MKTPMKKVLAAIVAAIGLAAFAEPTVKFNTVKLADPRTGEISCTYTTSGFEGKPYDLVIEVGAEGAESKTVTVKNVTEGTATKTLDVKTLLGKAYPDVTLFAELKEHDEGVQLWANGPYFAKCNVGATKPEEYGYYFWWGDTEGYKRNAAGNGWVSVKDGTTIQFSESDTTASQTYGKDNATLCSDGWIDESDNLTMAHDAARAYLGGDWRMPTSAEIQALVDNTTRTWTNDWNGTGVAGCIVTGNGEYADCSLFFPAAGLGCGFSLFGSYGYCWSSTPNSSYSDYAWTLTFYSIDFCRNGSGRYYGQCVRPVRGFAE